VSISLSSSEYQGLTGTITFRIYAYDDSDSTGDMDRLDNVVLNGTLSAIPEPSSFALLAGMFGLCLVALRRR
jgi:hypothetical protein